MDTYRAIRGEEGIILDLGPGDYELCREALADIASGTGSVARMVAAARFSDRTAWAGIVSAWEDIVANHGPIAHLTIYRDGTARAWPGTLDSYHGPLPWDTEAN